ncbi:MAG: sel1 repeat family protein [Deltaproteobacteria bacterium]|nr:sel1 repeat family protein [Deltaproteobacteria bacterium]
MGHNFIINEQFIPIAVSCPRCDEELQEPTVRCPVCDWEFHFTCDDVSEEEAEAYWLKAQFATHLYQIKKYCKAAEQGDDQAQYHLGKAYCNGIGVEKDQAEGVRWYRMAAEQGNIDAQFVLGVLYSRGEGVGADNDEAIKWFRKAADQGDKSALNHLRRIEI